MAAENMWKIHKSFKFNDKYSWLSYIGSWGDNLQIILQIKLIKECFETSSHDFSDTEKSFADLWKTFDPY